MHSWFPLPYKDATDYFIDVITFLEEYKWIYNWNVTDILIENAVSNLPPDWLAALDLLSGTELNELHSGCIKDDWPLSLKKFLLDCQKFRLSIKDDLHREPNLSPRLRKGLSPKKEHEVVRLAALIHSECSKHNLNFVVDIGSGLGYLCEVLHFEYGYNILGLESDPKRTAKALERHLEFQKSVNVQSSGKLAYSTCHLSDDSAHEVERKLQEVCDSSSVDVCMVGLHACGDLTTSALRLFHQISQLKLLILLPCCYHKRALKTSRKGEEDFVNFPLSDPLRKAVEVFEDRTGCRASRFLRRPMLRLAAQRSSNAWEQVQEKYPNERVINTLATASLYLLAHKEKATLKKKKRRPVRRSQRTSLDNFLSDAIDRYDFSSSRIEGDETKLTKLRDLVNEQKQYLRHIGVLLALQAALQPVVEGLVLADFAAKLNSDGYSDTRLLRLTDDILSPRGVAVIASKTSSPETHELGCDKR